MTHTALIRKGNESGFVVTVPSLPGCVTQGRTRREALANAKEAIAAYVEALMENGLPVPREVGIERIELEVLAR